MGPAGFQHLDLPDLCRQGRGQAGRPGLARNHLCVQGRAPLGPVPRGRVQEARAGRACHPDRLPARPHCRRVQVLELSQQQLGRAPVHRQGKTFFLLFFVFRFFFHSHALLVFFLRPRGRQKRLTHFSTLFFSTPSFSQQVTEGLGVNAQALPTQDIKTTNIYSRWQNNTLQADDYRLNLTTTALPKNQGFDWLRPAVDAATSFPVGDAIAPAASYLQFRDPVLFGIAKTQTITTANGASPAVQVFDPSANQTAAQQGKFIPANVYAMSKVNLFEAAFNQIQWRPCIARAGATGAEASPELIRVRPELIAVSIVGARTEPQLIDISPHLIKVQAVGAQWNPEYINVEPILVQVSPKVNIAGKAVAKEWQKDKPGAPAKSRRFVPSKEKDKRLTLAPYAGPHTTGR